MTSWLPISTAPKDGNDVASPQTEPHPSRAASTGAVAITKAERAAYWASLNPAQRRALELAKAREESEDPRFNCNLVERARKRMARVDAYPADIRKLIYEYGLEIVSEFLAHKVKHAKSIRHLIETVRCNPQVNGQNRFRFNTGPNRKQNQAADEWDDGERYTAVEQGPTAMAAAFQKAGS